MNVTLTTHPDRSFPVLHPRPAKGWLNDPNGIHFAGGRWHVYFQYNPASARHNLIQWGHVSSADLVTWREEPVALMPQEGGPDAFGCWTGVGTVDDGVPTMVYSGVLSLDGTSEVVIARGDAGSVRFAQVGHVAASMPDDPDVIMVRDPFLFELEGRRFAIQGAGLADGRPALLLYDASDLDHWTYHGTLLTGDHPVAAGLPEANVWECPQLVRIGDDWVATFSIWLNDVTLDVQYLVGSLTLGADGLPHFEPRALGSADHGASFYAPQAVQVTDPAAGPERVLLWGWAREVAPDGVRGRTQEDNDAVGWSGMLTFPRELTLDGDQLVVSPARELGALRGDSLDGVAVLPDQAEVLLAGSGTATLTLGDQTVWSGEVSDGTRILIDASVVEVYRDGDVATTLRAYPADGESYGLVLADGVSFEAWRLGA